MYKIYADDTLIYDSNLEDYIITKGTISKEVNKSGSFTFTIYQNHPYYDRIQKLKTIITVYKNNRIVFRGRVITDNSGFFNDKTFTCEGELSFFLDSIQRPFNFTGTPAELLEQFITVHNSQVDTDKQFQLGEVTVTDPNDYINRSNTEYEDTLTNINNRLLEPLGGYLHITRDENNVPFLNWFEDFPYESGQPIEFGENLLDFTKTNSAEEIATGIIPLGAKLESGEDSTRLTIESVNDGKDYIEDESAVAKYGKIYKVVTWDDVTTAENLLANATSYLAEIINQNITIELSAIDLSYFDRSIDDFRLGDYIRITSKPHNLEDRLLLQKQTIDLLKPDNDKITLGYTYSSFTDTSLNSNTKNDSVVKRIETIESNYVVNATVSEEIETLRSLINQTSTSIVMEVSETYATADGVQETVSTSYQQLKDSFELSFNTLRTSIDDNDTEARREFEEIKKYIRFVNGTIVLGDSTNPITLTVENDKIVIRENGIEVAYFNNQKLYITEAEILGSMQIGNFAYIPRENGNLSFKKIGG